MIRTKPSNKAYRDGWDRIFMEGKHEEAGNDDDKMYTRREGKVDEASNKVKASSL